MSDIKKEEAETSTEEKKEVVKKTNTNKKSEVLEEESKKSEKEAPTKESKEESKDSKEDKPKASNTKEQRKPIKSINDLIKESNNAEALAIKDKIDALKKDKSNLIYEIKSLRRRYNYKIAEGEAISNFVENGNNQIDTKKLIYLKKLKNRLEFKLSTQARISLYEEKDIIRKINIISNQLNDLYKFQRLKKKSELIKTDIEELKTKITEINNKINEMDNQLDSMYDNIRKILGITRHIDREKSEDYKNGPSIGQKRKFNKQPPPQQEINLEDIAVIKKK